MSIADKLLAANPNGLQTDTIKLAFESTLKEAEDIADKNETSPGPQFNDEDGETRSPFTKFRRSGDHLSLGGVMRSMVTGPRNDMEKRALSEGTDSAGGYTVPSVVSKEFYDALRPASTVLQVGRCSPSRGT